MQSKPDPHASAATATVAGADDLVARVFTWRRGFNAMHLIDLGVELGLFSAIAARPDVRPDALSHELGLHAPYVAAWCTSAQSLGLLDAEADPYPGAEPPSPGVSPGAAWRFRLAPFVDQVLANSGHPRYLGGYAQLGTRHATEDYRHARTAFRSGATLPFQGRSEEFAELVAQSLAGVNLMVARKILPGLPEVAAALAGQGALLDVGCGAGRLLVQLAKAFPLARCTGIDIDPTGLAAARAALAKLGLQERVRLVEGDLRTAVEAGSFDLVVMVEVLHEIDPAVRPELLRGCARALRPGGSLVIVDETYPSTPEQARQPEYRFALQTGLEELLWGNVVPTRGEQEWLLQQAGFETDVPRSLLGEGFTLLVARKPA